MTMIRAFFVSIILIFPFMGQAQLILEGSIWDAYTQTPLSEVKVSADNADLGYTDDAGKFSFELTTKPKQVQFSHPQYESRGYDYGTGNERVAIMLKPLERRLDEIVVSVYDYNRRLIETAGGIVKLKEAQLSRYDRSSLLPALNSIPGVRMDNRGAGGSSRISIRGSIIRAPFGVRNIKAYWNDIPITSPDGSTPIEVIDIENLGSLEVLKGPAGSLYGAGTGGVLLFRSKMNYNQGFSGNFNTTIGSNGLLRNSLSLGTTTSNTQIQVQYVRQRYDGYRDQEYVNKDLLNLQASFIPDDKRKISVYAYHFDGGWGLPGALRQEQVDEDPTQAVAFSKDGNASLYRKRTRLGLGHTYYFSKNFRNITTFYGNFTEKENPFGTTPFFNGYKIEAAQGLGLRSRLEYDFKAGDLEGMINVGLEWQREVNDLRNYDNVEGSIGALEEDSRTLSKWSSLFAQAELSLPLQSMLTLGLSYNDVSYDHTDFFMDDFDYSNLLEYTPVLSPRIALVKTIDDKIGVHGSLSYGFSPPTLWETINPDGSLNTDLDAETGINYELGIRGGLLNQRLQVDLIGYIFNMNTAILPQEFQNGVAFFNAGNTKQRGLEFSAQYELVAQNNPTFSRFNPWVSLSLQDYTFGDYIKEGNSLNGNKLPGVADHVFVAGLDIEFRKGLYFNLTYRNISDIPLNDSNQDFADGYQLLESRVGYKWGFPSGFGLDVYIGGNNLGNETYSDFLQVNAFGGKFFNPAPNRNFYGGFSLRFGQ